MPATWPATLLALAGAWTYSGLAGFGLPAQRAWVMAAVMLLARVGRRQLQSWNSLILALAVVLAFDPLSILNTGFWLSFVSVAVLLAGGLNVTAPASNWRQWPCIALGLAQLQWRMSLALLPIVLICFQQTSLLAPLVNLPMIPVLGVVVVPLALAGVLLATVWLDGGVCVLQLADWVLSWCMRFLRWSADLLPENMFVLPAMSNTGFVVLVLAVMLAILGRQHWHRVMGTLMIPCALGLLQTAPMRDVLQVQILDVGQGLAVAIHTPHHHLLYDAGPQFSESFDAGNDVVVPVLRKGNIDTLDRVMISHSDRDHAGGLQGLLVAYPTADYIASTTGLSRTCEKHPLQGRPAMELGRCQIHGIASGRWPL
jgi:competence protein ComEC